MVGALRRLVKQSLWLGASLLVAACAPISGAAPAETGVAAEEFTCPQPVQKVELSSDELNLFTFAEYVPDDFIRCFEQAYDVQVNWDVYSTNSELYSKLSVGGAAYDIVQPTDYIVAPMIRQGLLQPLDRTRVSGFDAIDPAYLNLPFDPNNQYTIPYQAGTYAIAVNTGAVENVPARWADLWNAEYAGRMTFLDDSRSVIGLTLLTLGYDLNSTDPAQLEEAKTRLMELVPNIKLFESDSPKTALIAGDVDLGMVWTGEAFLANQENPAIAYVYPEEGAILWQDNFALAAEAPHADAAYAWLNYILQPDLFWLTLRDFPYTNPNQGALAFAQANYPELYAAYMASNATNMPADAIARGHHIQDVGEALVLYDRIWTEVKGQ